MSYVDPSTGRTYPLTEARWRGGQRRTTSISAPAPGLGRDDITRGGTRSGVTPGRSSSTLDAAVSMGEGWTPLVGGEWDGARSLFKLEFMMPTGSFKDRGMTVMVSYLRSRGVERVLEDSSGNAGASLSAYAARRRHRAASWCRKRPRIRRSRRSPRAARTSSRSAARARTSPTRRSP